jgi:hypothetical protein
MLRMQRIRLIVPGAFDFPRATQEQEQLLLVPVEEGSMRQQQSAESEASAASAFPTLNLDASNDGTGLAATD